jgi:hypothetical protein
METKQIIEKTEALIDALRATCSAYGLSGDSSEYKIIAAHGVSVRSLDQGDRSLICSHIVAGTSRWDRYLGMTAAMTQYLSPRLVQKNTLYLQSCLYTVF